LGGLAAMFATSNLLAPEWENHMSSQPLLSRGGDPGTLQSERSCAERYICNYRSLECASVARVSMDDFVRGLQQ